MIAPQLPERLEQEAVLDPLTEPDARRPVSLEPPDQLADGQPAVGSVVAVCTLLHGPVEKRVIPDMRPALRRSRRRRASSTNAWRTDLDKAARCSSGASATLVRRVAIVPTWCRRDGQPFASRTALTAASTLAPPSPREQVGQFLLGLAERVEQVISAQAKVRGAARRSCSGTSWRPAPALRRSASRRHRAGTLLIEPSLKREPGRSVAADRLAVFARLQALPDLGATEESDQVGRTLSRANTSAPCAASDQDIGPCRSSLRGVAPEG